jgi:hypothetical protein
VVRQTSNVDRSISGNRTARVPQKHLAAVVTLDRQIKDAQAIMMTHAGKKSNEGKYTKNAGLTDLRA